MDITYKREYKNAKINIIVEDDLITTYEIEVDGKVVEKEYVYSDNYADGFPNNRKFFDKVYEFVKGRVDELFNELVESIK